MSRYIPSPLWEELRDIIRDIQWHQRDAVTEEDILDRLEQAGYKVEPK